MVDMAMTLRLTPEQDAMLTKLAADQKISKQEAAAVAIERDAGRSANAGEVREWADHALKRYAGLLDRLAQ